MIREIKKEEYELAGKLIWDTYLKTEAKNDTLDGQNRFYTEFVDGDDLNNMLNNETLHLFGYYDDDTLMGLISFMNNGYIMHLFVGMDYMHRGIARKLLEFIFKEAKNQGFNSVTLDSSVYALDFYKKLGFKELGDKIVEDGMAYIPLIKTL